MIPGVFPARHLSPILAALAAGGLAAGTLAAGPAEGVSALGPRPAQRTAEIHPAVAGTAVAGTPRARFGLPPDDSLGLLRRARERQEEFERLRRDHLPFTVTSQGKLCDEILGRFCFWHEEDDRWRPPPEPAAVAEARARLAAFLDSAHAALPGSAWLAGQSVRYLVEDGRPGEALLAAHRCEAARWWCGALAGYALHAAGSYQTADSAFALALVGMGLEEACRWRDIDHLLEGAARDRYRRLSCHGRRGVEERLWRLADPLYLVPGNDRRTAHFARRALERILRDSATPYRVSWGEDLGELLVRYGWPEGWERTRRDPALARTEISVVGHHSPRGARFVPPTDVLLDPLAAEPGAWSVDVFHPRSTHTPAYAPSVGPLEHQLAAFHRGDSLRAVAALRVDADSVPPDAPVEAGLFLLGPAGELMASDRARSARRDSGGALVLDATATGGRHLVSVEALSAHAGRAERARYGLRRRPPSPLRPAISDLLLVRPPPGADSIPPDLDRVAGRALPTLATRPGDRLGLYWELYHLPGPPRPARVTVSLERIDRGLLERLGGLVGLGDEGPAVSLGWRDTPEPVRRVHPRSLVLTLPRRLQEGRYRLGVRVELRGREPLVASRVLEVRADGSGR